MIRNLTHALDNLLGRGEAAVTVPPLDGAFRPNRRLDEAPVRIPVPDVDDLTLLNNVPQASAGRTLFALDAATQWQPRAEYADTIVALAALESDGIAVALANGDIVVEGGRWSGRHYAIQPALRCITAMTCHGDALYVANGSAAHTSAEWQSDLMRRGATGSVWRIDLSSGSATALAIGLAYPAGLAVDDDGVVCSEAWKHRLVRLRQASRARGSGDTVCADLPGYPGRLSRSTKGWWLAVFAPRNQLVEFVLREPAYRTRMMDEVPSPFWIAPALRSNQSFYEPLQGGAVKQMGQLKPWAPTLSAGLCVKLDPSFQPVSSLHSRADGHTHGVTAVVEQAGLLFVAARGDGVVVRTDVELA